MAVDRWAGWSWRGPEVAAPLNAGQAATHAFAWRLFGNEGLLEDARVQACVSTRCLHQARSWDTLPDPKMQWLSVASLLALTARRLQGRAGGPTMRCSGGCEQSRYVARAARLAPPYVVAILQSGAAALWRNAVLDGMERMRDLGARAG